MTCRNRRAATRLRRPRRRKRRIWVAGLCCAVAAATAYALTRPALTMTQQTFCGQEAHTHSLSCYADAQADLESASVWEQTIPQTLSGQWRAGRRSRWQKASSAMPPSTLQLYRR